MSIESSGEYGNGTGSGNGSAKDSSSTDGMMVGGGEKVQPYAGIHTAHSLIGHAGTGTDTGIDVHSSGTSNGIGGGVIGRGARERLCLSRGQFLGSLIRYYTKRDVNDLDSTDSHEADVDWQELPIYSLDRLRHGMELHLFKEAYLWKSAAVECFGMAVQVYWSVTTVLSVPLNPTQYYYPPLQIALIHTAIISIMILATARSSGGHLNSSITFATWCAGLCEFPRMVLYIPAQIVGSIIGAYTVKSAISTDIVNSSGLGGCYLGPLSTLSGFVFECFFTLVVLFVAFGIALDEDQRQVFGPIFGPLMIGLVNGIIIYVSPALAGSSGYTGASANPSRCIGPAIAFDAGASSNVVFVNASTGARTVSNNAQWIYWIAAFTAGVMISVLYRNVPPSHMTQRKIKKAA